MMSVTFSDTPFARFCESGINYLGRVVRIKGNKLIFLGGHCDEVV